jgi:hypothetical protein
MLLQATRMHLHVPACYYMCPHTSTCQRTILATGGGAAGRVRARGRHETLVGTGAGILQVYEALSY